jgi:hypothetical protein
MATATITNSAQAITLPPGTPVAFTGDGTHAGNVTIGFTSGGAASGVVVAAIPASSTAVLWTWPGIFINYGMLTLYLYFSVAFNVTLTYPS